MDTIGADAAKLAGLQIDLLQKLRQQQVTPAHLEWFNNLSREQRDRLLAEHFDPRYFLISEFKLTVPKDYDHRTQLARFREKHGKEFSFFNENITDENFSRVTDALVPGRTYLAKVFGINQGKVVSSEDNIALYESQNALLTGAQGLSVAYEQARGQFPVSRWLVSMDREQALWEDSSGARRVPAVYRCRGGYWYADLGPFEFDWSDYFCLFCLCDQPSDA